MKKLIDLKNRNHFLVEVDHKIIDGSFLVNFQVTKDASYDWNCFIDDKKVLSRWNLWNYDVVEVFLQIRKNKDDIVSSYLELEVSPNDESLQLIILEPKQKTYTPMDLNWSYKNTVKNDQWNCEIKIEGVKKGLVYGNFFACLGKKPNREYHQLFFNDDILDFHRPENFGLLCQLS